MSDEQLVHELNTTRYCDIERLSHPLCNKKPHDLSVCKCLRVVAQEADSPDFEEVRTKDKADYFKGNTLFLQVKVLQ